MVVQSLLRQSQDIAVVVNVAGKMRMLSQQTGLQFFASRREPNLYKVDAGTFEQAFEDAYKALMHGGSAFGLQLDSVQSHQKKHLLDIHEAWVNYVSELNRFRAEENKFDNQQILSRTDTKAILDNADLLLNNIEILIADLLASYKAAHNKITYSSYALFIFDLLVLLLVYRVFINRVIRPIELLASQSKQLTLGNFSVKTNFKHKDEFGQLSKVLNLSSDHIENLLQDLEKRQKHLNRANEIFDGLASNTVAGIYILDQSLNFVYANQHLAKILRCNRAVFNNKFSIENLFTAAEYKKVTKHINDRLSGKLESSHYETRAIRFDGTQVEVEIFGSSMHTESGIFILGLALDISARKAAEASLRRAALIYQNSSEGMVVTDKDGTVIDVNSAFEIITGYPASEILGKRLNYISSGRHGKKFYEQMWRSIEETGTWSGDICNLRKTGEEYLEHLKINTVYAEDGSVHSRIGLFSDVTEKRRQEALVWRQANYDSLTKLPNRLMFEHALEQTILHARRENSSFGLLFLDLDYFKEVNDTYGHEEGDELLRIMADRLNNTVRKTDMVARLGGDEFTLILRDIKSADDITPIAEKIIQSVAQPYKLKSNTVSISASVGISLFPQHGNDSAKLLKNADLAMYAAKEKGRNQFCIFNQEMRLQANTRRQLIKEINLALIEKQFELYYQPIVDIKTNQIAKFEALIRWNHPDKGLIMPGDFISMAEDTGQIHAIGNWVFEQAANQVIEWRQLFNKEIMIGINVSPIQFYDDYLDPQSWIQYLSDRNVPVSSIVIEITERLYLDTENNSHAEAKLATLSQAGFKIGLDDFGTGYSSLSHLNKFAIDYLKIDKSYINNLEKNQENFVLCQAMVAMAHELDMLVIAEGVRNQQQHQLISETGCDYGQGFFYSSPLPAADIKSLFL